MLVTALFKPTAHFVDSRYKYSDWESFRIQHENTVNMKNYISTHFQSSFVLSQKQIPGCTSGAIPDIVLGDTNPES